jgi:hypothetical protein
MEDRAFAKGRGPDPATRDATKNGFIFMASRCGKAPQGNYRSLPFLLTPLAERLAHAKELDASAIAHALRYAQQ